MTTSSQRLAELGITPYVLRSATPAAHFIEQQHDMDQKKNIALIAQSTQVNAQLFDDIQRALRDLDLNPLLFDSQKTSAHDVLKYAQTLVLFGHTQLSTWIESLPHGEKNKLLWTETPEELITNKNAKRALWLELKKHAACA